MRNNGCNQSEKTEGLLCFLCKLILLVIVIRLFFTHIIMLCIVPSGSMETTLMTHDIIITNKLDTNVNRYDIVCFNAPVEEDTVYVKRVIGLPGETITIENGSIYANGILLNDSFAQGVDNPDGDGTYVVPEDCYFMVGDNRTNSYDSRYWGVGYEDNEEEYNVRTFVSEDNILSTVLAVVPVHLFTRDYWISAK